MTNKGKHSSQTPGTFYRDLAIMILGIILVGAAVLLQRYLFSDQPDTGPTTTTTSTTVPVTTTTTRPVGTTGTLGTTTSTSEPPE